MEVQEARNRQLGVKRKGLSAQATPGKYISQEEAAHLLRLRQSDLDELVSRGELASYKLGGKYIRFKKEDVERLKAEILLKRRGSVFERIQDFLYFNSFYIAAIIIVALMLIVILKF